MITGRIQGDKALIKMMTDLGKKAVAIVTKELKPEVQAELKAVKAAAPVGETKFLKRSPKIKKVRKKRRYTVAFRVVATPPKPDKDGKKKRYYAFATHYGVKNGRGKQRATKWMSAGQAQSEERASRVLSNIARGVAAEWKKR